MSIVSRFLQNFTLEHALYLVLVPSWFLTGYFLILFLHSGNAGYNLSLDFEKKIAYVPVMAIPYVSCYIFVFLPGLIFNNQIQFRRGAISLLTAMTIAFLFFIFYPVRLIAPAPVGDIDKILLSIPWLHDNGWNAFPSLHVTMATLSACSLLKTSRLISVLSIATWLLICASTVLLKKHYVLDVAAGVLLGTAIHFLLVEPVLKKEGIKWRL